MPRRAPAWGRAPCARLWIALVTPRAWVGFPFERAWQFCGDEMQCARWSATFVTCASALFVTGEWARGTKWERWARGSGRGELHFLNLSAPATTVSSWLARSTWLPYGASLPASTASAW